MRIKRIWFNAVLIFFFPAICFAQGLTVAVAANVQYAFEELKVSFERQAGIVLEPIVGSSGKLAIQIENGAPFDLFLSADMEYPETLSRKGMAYNTPQIYAYGTLVLWTMKDMDLSQGIKILTDPQVKKIALGSPQIAPYGREAVNVLKHYDLYSQVNGKLVYGQSIAQVNQFIVSQAADVGFTAKSAVLAAGMNNQGLWIEIEKEAYQPIAQGVVILKHAQEKNLDAAQEFFDFLYSKPAREILKKYGYRTP